MWNALRLVRKKLKIESNIDDFKPSATCDPHPDASRIDLWILSRLAECTETMNSAFKSLNFAQATNAIYNFWMYDLCDIYLVCSFNAHQVVTNLIADSFR